MIPAKYQVLGILVMCLLLDTHASASRQQPVGARQLGIGDAFAAVADDGNTIAINPGGLSRLERYILNTMYVPSLFSVGGIDQSYVSLIAPLGRNGATGLGWHRLGISDDAIDFSNNQFDFSYGRRFGNLIHVGGNLKYLQMSTNLDEIKVGKASGWGGDLGILLLPTFLADPLNRLRVAVVVKDVWGTRVEHQTGVKEKIYSPNLRLGLAYDLMKDRPQKRWTVALDVDDRIHLGSEFSPHPLLTLRAGLQKDLHTSKLPTVAAGFSLNWKEWINFHYAYVMPPTLPATSYFSMSFAFSEKSPVQIQHVKFVEEGLFLAHHVDYASREAANVILITEHIPADDSDVWEFPLDDYAEVVSIETTADKAIRFKPNNQEDWQTLLRNHRSVGKGARLRIPPNCRLRLRMEQTGYLHDYVSARLVYELEDTNKNGGPVYALDLEGSDKIGRVWVKNHGNSEVDVNMKLRFTEYTTEFHDVTDSMKIPRNTVASISLQYINFLNIRSILSRITTDTPTPARIAATTRREDKTYKEVSLDIPDLKINGKNTMFWEHPDDLLKIGSFICPMDQPVKHFADTVRVMYQGGESLSQLSNADLILSQITNATLKKALLLCTALRAYGLAYTDDPQVQVSSIGDGTDIIWYAREMLESKKFEFEGEEFSKSAGDCDDSTVLLASLLEAIDVPTLLILQEGHILLAFDTGISLETAKEVSIDPFGYKWYLQPEPTNTAWIPIETTRLSAGDFTDAWKTGLQQTRNNEILDMVPVRDAQQGYKPANLYNEDTWLPNLPPREKIDEILIGQQQGQILQQLGKLPRVQDEPGATASPQ